jgi:hypothetical protein
MKRFSVLLLLLLFLLLMAPLTAYADMIYEPENEFYKQNRSYIVFLGRSFIANGEGEAVSVKKEPGAKNDIHTLKNGEVTYIQYSCLYDGDFWGFTFDYSGWIKLDQMLVLYDYISFEEDHLEEFYSYDGDYTAIKDTMAAIAWPWPGCETPIWTFEGLDTEHFWASFAYRDEEGREWGFISYLYGSRNIWVCLSDPLKRDMPAFNVAAAPAPWVSETEHTDIGRSANPPLTLIICLVAVLVIGTAALIKIFWKPNKNKPGGEENG